MPLHADMYQTLRRVLQDFPKELITYPIFADYFQAITSNYTDYTRYKLF